jgi:hypothetical protein
VQRTLTFRQALAAFVLIVATVLAFRVGLTHFTGAHTHPADPPVTLILRLPAATYSCRLGAHDTYKCTRERPAHPRHRR